MTTATMTAAAEGMSKEELTSIQSFELPLFEPPYPSKMNPNAEQATAAAYLWIAEQSLDKIYASPKALKACIDADFPDLAMRVYVEAGLEEASFVCKLFMWFFMLDDYLDDAGNFYCPEKSASLLLELNVVLMWSFPDAPQLRNNLVAFLDEGHVAERDATLKYLDRKLALARLHPGTVYDTSSPQIPPLCKAFRDLWATLWSSMPPDFMLRWGLLCQRYVLANAREVRNRKENSIPSVDEYIALRRDTVAMYPSMVLVEFLDKVHLPDEVFNCPEMQHLIVLINDILSWYNDIVSFKKEVLVQNDVHNLVFIISHERGCSYAEAAQTAFQMMLDRLGNLETAFEDLKQATPPVYKPAISRYIIAAQYWVSGGHDWHVVCKRYI